VNATVAAAVFVTGALLGSVAPAASRVDRGSPAPPLVGARCETMRALARYLDETAQGALEGAADRVRHGSPSDARFLAGIRSFARSTGDLHRTIGDCREASLELPSQVADLARRASLLRLQIRAADALAAIYDEWAAVADALQRMTRLLEGHDIEVPLAYVVPPLSGAGLDEFRRLASDLHASATRAHDTATRAVGNYRDRGRQFLGELRHFAIQSRELQGRGDAGTVDPGSVGPVVDLLLEEARQADRRMRDAQVFTEVWDDSGRTITILQRMATLVRS
jgi:hypothetical protein